MNDDIFKSCLMIFVTELFTGFHVKGREQRGKE
jgi:hypothetical protein